MRAAAAGRWMSSPLIEPTTRDRYGAIPSGHCSGLGLSIRGALPCGRSAGAVYRGGTSGTLANRTRCLSNTSRASPTNSTDDLANAQLAHPRRSCATLQCDDV